MSDEEESELTYDTPYMGENEFSITKNNSYSKFNVTEKIKARSNSTCVSTMFIVVAALLILAVTAICIALALESTKLESEIKQKHDNMESQLNNLSLSFSQQLNYISEVFQMKIHNNSREFNYQIEQCTTTVNEAQTTFELALTKIEALNSMFTQHIENIKKPGHFPFFSASSCTALPPSSPSGYYWVRISNGSAVHVYCNMTGRRLLFPASSCAALLHSSPSGYYWVRASNGSAVHVYCNMTKSCGGVTGGWMRVAELDMTNSSHQCPSGLRQRTDSSIRTCVRNTDSPGFSSITYSTANIQYSRVCGKVIAYQKGTPDAFERNTKPISTNYVDGVSLTHGSDPRKHIWTFAATPDETTVKSIFSCRCMHNDAPLPQFFVGSDYFCDTAVRHSPVSATIYFNDPLWDGAGCGPTSTCCSFNNPPWFYKQLSQPTIDDIEMRVCRDENQSNEDIAITSVELFVQ